MTKSGCFPKGPAPYKVCSPPCLYPGLGFSLMALQKSKLTLQSAVLAGVRDREALKALALSQS